MAPIQTNEHLAEGSLYSRNELKARFSITDASLYTGIFAPDGHNSIWLFITARKTRDRIQYVDVLDGPVLVMESQMQGRKDDMLRTHSRDRRDILVFYREMKTEFPDYAFRYKGRFQYVHDVGVAPAHFIFRYATENPTAT